MIFHLLSNINKILSYSFHCLFLPLSSFPDFISSFSAQRSNPSVSYLRSFKGSDYCAALVMTIVGIFSSYLTKRQKAERIPANFLFTILERC